MESQRKKNLQYVLQKTGISQTKYDAMLNRID